MKLITSLYLLFGSFNCNKLVSKVEIIFEAMIAQYFGYFFM